MNAADFAVPFCDDFVERGLARETDSAQEIEVLREIARVQREGGPVLRAILASNEPLALQLGMQLLSRGPTVDTSEHPEIADFETMPVVYLRLVDPDLVPWVDPYDYKEHKGRCVPPQRDAQGRLMPPTQRGKVLNVKVGNKGGNLDPAHTDRFRLAAFRGDERVRNADSGKALYMTREVARTPAEYSLRDAVAILRQWGFGVAPHAFRSAPERPRPSEPHEIPQCCWLVEEVSREEFLAFRDAERASKTKSKPSQG